MSSTVEEVPRGVASDSILGKESQEDYEPVEILRIKTHRFML